MTTKELVWGDPQSDKGTRGSFPNEEKDRSTLCPMHPAAQNSFLSTF